MIVVAGLIGTETVKFQEGAFTHLGGSACYAAVGSSLFANTSLMGVASEQQLSELKNLFLPRRIDVSLVQPCLGKGFSYDLSYEQDNHTLKTFSSQWGLNAICDYPDDGIPHDAAYFFASDDPARQLRFIRKHPNITYGIGINEHFIRHFSTEYRSLIARARMVVLNQREANLLNSIGLLSDAALITTDGSGEISTSFGGNKFTQPIVFDDKVVDPTGCGDTFAGASFALWAKARFDADQLAHIVSRAVRLACCALTTRGVTGLIKETSRIAC